MLDIHDEMRKERLRLTWVEQRQQRETRHVDLVLTHKVI
jgi:hypothetical protein